MVAYAEVELVGIGSDGTGDALMVLGEVDPDRGRRAVPIPIGEHEARAIDRVAHGGRLVHGLLVDVVRRLGRDVGAVVLTAASAGAFSAVVVLDDGTRLPARPCDAVPVALAAGRPMRIPTAVLDRTAIPLEYTTGMTSDGVSTEAVSPAGAPPSEAEIDAAAAAMRRWLDTDAVGDLTDPPEA